MYRTRTYSPEEAAVLDIHAKAYAVFRDATDALADARLAADRARHAGFRQGVDGVLHQTPAAKAEVDRLDAITAAAEDAYALAAEAELEARPHNQGRENPRPRSWITRAFGAFTDEARRT